MPLYTLDGSRVAKVPYPDTYALTKRIPNELPAVKAYINTLIDGTEINTSSWMPGNDWSNTPLDALWRTACKKDEQLPVKE